MAGIIMIMITLDDHNFPLEGSFTNYVDMYLGFVDHLPTSVDIFYLINVHKKSAFLDHLPTLY